MCDLLSEPTVNEYAQDGAIVWHIEHDIDAESPGDWDEPYTLHMSGHASWLRQCGFEPFEISRGCDNCGEGVYAHPIEEDEYNDACALYVLPSDIIPVFWDSSGPWSCITIVDIADGDELARWADDSVGRDGATGYFTVSPYAREWLDELEETTPANGNEMSRASVLQSVVDNWSTWARGDVYTVAVERELKCGHSEIVESLGGIYGSDHATSHSLMEDLGIESHELERVKVKE